ncbi:hypothetical protein C8J36_11218 [Rhizobium sp. PP-F2F-G48]|uniref:hypothetical protein n=1 Tax=Rhizobium sp. PP-F2F-G48 TaxID=2135651 RepID=UPI0010F37CC7|nr:hypothetical protein [Rhizobium sp. PP-F2F-G48]TCM49651.1 hypothetical protein C8J36_11218 [Rhizobium sp. PP-F2F-G48]
MTLDLIGSLKSGISWVLQRQPTATTQPSERPQSRDDDRDLTERDVEFSYWAVRGPWH